MKFAICNEMFEGMSHAETFRAMAELGYQGAEIAPFTLIPDAMPFDIFNVSNASLEAMRAEADAAGIQIIGLHWLFAKTSGLYLTTPDEAVRRKTSEYLAELARVSQLLGGHVMVLGSPPQRNLLPDVTHAKAMEFAAEVLRHAMPACKEHGQTIALEPLGPSEGDFLNTAELGRELAAMVDHPNCKVHLDVKAMSSEPTPIPEIIRSTKKEIAHFHANDPNLLGPGMGEIEFTPILAALKEIGYDGWVSVETFDRSIDVQTIAQTSLSTLHAACETVGISIEA